MIRRFLNARLTRQQFVRSIGRWAAMGALALLAVCILRRREPQAGDDATTSCGYDLSCRQCAEIGRCRHARASAARRAVRKDRS